MTDREQASSASPDAVTYDVAIVGAGPAGLAAAIRLKQLAFEKGRDVSVCVLEKGSDPGAHIISGAVMDTKALDELLPGWQEKDASLALPVSEECFLFLSEEKSFRMPNWLLPGSLKNTGHHLVSLSRLVRWLAGQAEELGVDIFAGYAATGILYSDDGAVRGVVTGAAGIGRDGEKTTAYRPGTDVFASYTFFAEGARGQLGRQLAARFFLDKKRDPQSYAISLKEVWQAAPGVHKPGLVIHTAGWPLDSATQGGAFLYHMPKGRIAVGLVAGLAYENPYLSPYGEFQRFKTHPSIRVFLKGGTRLEYGSRAVASGGIQALPQLVFSGGALIGCNAGFMNGARLKGIHTAIKSGMLAAQSAFDALEEGRSGDVLHAFPHLFRKSWLYEELYRARNFKPSMKKGLMSGSFMLGVEQTVLLGKAPWTFHRSRPDYFFMKPASACRPISYDRPDGILQYDIPSSLHLSGTHHEENQPSHLRLVDDTIPVELNLATYAGPESRYCPAGVYEFIRNGEGLPQLRINAANCLHCKTCDIKDPSQNIVWIAPEGGNGPEYLDM